MTKLPTFYFAILICAASSSFAPAKEGRSTKNADWSQWRGPRGDGVSDESNWSADWPKDGPKILWKTEVNTRPADNNDGSSTVAVADGGVFVVGTDCVLRLDVETGEQVWKAPFTASHSTPAVKDGKVYVYGTQGRLLCLNTDTGDEVWTREMHEGGGRTRGPKKSGAYGYAASPVFVGDLVVVSARLDGGALVAVDPKTGEIRWKAFHRGHANYAMWSTPVLATIENRPTLVWLPGPSVVGLDPTDGSTIWKYEIPEENGKAGCAAATPVVWGNRVVAQYHPPHARGYTFCLEIEDGKAEVAWESRNLANWYLSCIGYDGCLYGVDQAPRGRPKDMGALQCYDIASGELLWSVNGFGQDGSKPVRRTRTNAPTGVFAIADGKIISWAAELVVASVSGDGHELLASAKIDYGGYRAVPVLSDGRLFLRTKAGQLICVDVRRHPGS